MLKDILNFRRAVRYYAPTPISEEKVRECLKLATLAPTSSNMQLYELYHITDKALLEKLAHACLEQRTATTAQQMVVFVTRQDKHRTHARAILEFERGNVQRNSPPERQAKRIKDKEAYMLAMAEEGYDTCPLEGYDSRRIKKLLHLPCGAEVNMVVTCGVREERGIWGERFRLPFEEVYRHND